MIGKALSNYQVTAECAHAKGVEGKYVARSASDNTDDWPYWMVWNGHINVTGKVCEALGYGYQDGAVFTARENAERLASEANAKGV